MKSSNEKSSSCNSTGRIKDERLKTPEKAGMPVQILSKTEIQL
jgi:hypothetical protein